MWKKRNRIKVLNKKLLLWFDTGVIKCNYCLSSFIKQNLQMYI